MPLAARVGNWLFCHSGYYPRLRWSEFVAKAKGILQEENYVSAFILGEDSILEAKNWWETPRFRTELLARLAQDGMEGVIHGHQPRAYGLKNKIGAIENGRLIKLDVGMAANDGNNEGAMLQFPKPEAFATHDVPESQVLYP
jgi:hypothetical protein